MRSSSSKGPDADGTLLTRVRIRRSVIGLVCVGIILEIAASAVCHLIKNDSPLDEVLALLAMVCFVWATLLFVFRNVKDKRITGCMIGAALLLLLAVALDLGISAPSLDRSFLFGQHSQATKLVHDMAITAGLTLLLVSLALSALQAHQAQWRLELQNEELLRETKERVLLATAIEQSDEAMVITDPGGVIQYVNPAFESLTGYPKDELIGKTTAFFRGGKHATPAYREVWRTIAGGKTWRGHLVNRRKDGTECEVSAVISCVLDDSGAIVNYIGAQHDVTVQASLERQLRQAQKMEVLGTFAGRIAHDFNNILALILGHSEMALRRMPEQDPVRGHVQRIEKAGRRASKLIKQMLTFSRQMEQERKPVAVHLVVREVLDLLRASLPPTVQLRESVADCGMVMADATQIHQVVMNLCTNACQALQGRKGTLEVALDVAEVGTGFLPDMDKLGPGPYVRLSVRDTGSGIEPSILPHIFDPFFTTKEPGVGTGLGLSTVHGIVATHGGAIAVRSEAGQGSTFEVCLPRLDGASQAAVPELEPPVGGRERIILVDDSEEIMEMACMSLEQMGYAVSAFSSSVKAFEQFRTSPQDCDLVITDQVMPEMSGTALARELVALRPGLPIILISGFGLGLPPDQARAMGISACLMKPFSGRTLGDTIRRVLDEKKPGAVSETASPLS